MAISDNERIIQALQNSPRQKLTYAEIAAAVGAKLGKSATKWTPEYVEHLARALNTESDQPVDIVHGGVEYHGRESHDNPSIYDAVEKGFPKWGKGRGLSNATPLERLKLGELAPGKWTNPDVVFRVFRRAGATPAMHLHSVEVEQAAGFNVVSVYQAYEQGRGAEFRWVFFQGTPRDKRALSAAKDIGVGLVAMPRPRTPSAWLLVNNAREQGVTKEARRDLLERISKRTRMGTEPNS